MIKYTFQISNSWNTKREKIVLLCMIIKVITRLRVRSFLKRQTWWSTNIYMVSQILTNVKEITLVTWMLPARTPTDPTFVNAALNLMEMVESAHVNLIYLLKYLEYSCSSLTWSCWGGHVISLSYINDTGSVLSLPGAVLKCAVWERRSSNSDPAEFLWISNFTVLASKP